MALFRQEVIENRRPRLHGNVVIPTHIPHATLSGLFFLFLCLIVAVGGFGTFAKSEQVPGRIVPTMGLVKVRVPRSGTLAALNVHQGDSVQKGTLLAVIDTALIGAGGQSVQAHGVAALDGQLSLLRRSKGLEEMQLKADLAINDAEQQEQERGLKVTADSLRLNEEILVSAKQTYEDAATLQANGHISRIEFESRKQSYLLAQQKVGEVRQGMAVAGTRIRSLKLERERREVEYRKTVGQIDADILTLQQRRAEISGDSRSALRAPVDGTIASITPAVGESVSSQDAIVTILPRGGDLRAELLVPSRAVGFVRAGQEVRLAIDAFPYEQFGMVKGSVVSVTRTMLMPSEIGVQGMADAPVYRVIARLGSDHVSFGAETFLLQPDMRLNATIVLERLSLFDWLMSPLRGLGARA